MRQLSLVGVLAVLLGAIPVFGAEDTAMNEVSVVEQATFKALQEMPSHPQELSDTELARVEGGFHKEVASALFAAAYLYALKQDFISAANAAIAGALIGTQIVHDNAFRGRNGIPTRVSLRGR